MRRAGVECKKTFIVTTRVITKGAAGSIGDSVPVCEETPLGPSAQRGQVNVQPPLVRLRFSFR